MVLIKLLFFVLVISLVKCVPVDESKKSNRPSTRRATLETYRYNHPPSISIPVSVVFEENEPENNQKLKKSAKINTKTPNKNLVPSEEPYSVAIPVSVVFEEKPFESDKLDKSKKLNSKLSDENKIPSQNSSETIPVSTIFEDTETPSDNTLKFEKQNPDINIKKAKTLNELSDIAVPVAVVFEEENVSKINILKSEKSSRDSTHDKQEHTKENKISEQQTEPIILTSTESVMLAIDIEVPKNNTTSAKPSLKEEQSKVILRPQPKQYYQLEYQIPVAVVYDEPINEVQTSRNLNNSKEQVRGRNSRRRRPTLSSTTEPTIEVTSIDGDFQHKPLKSEVNPISRRRHRVKSTTEPTIEVTSVDVDFQHKPLKIEVNPISRRRHRVKQTQDTSSKIETIPVVIFTENENTQYNSREEKSRINPLPITETSSEKPTSKTRTQSKTPLQTQNRNSSFKAQQTEERRQDYSARKRERDPVVPIVKSDIHAFGNSGSYSYSYEGGDGTKAFGKGELKTFKDDKTGEAVVGGFSYKDKDGNDISLSYTADENGYRPVGDHLPTPPPIPVAIQRALDYLATKTTPAPVTEAGEA